MPAKALLTVCVSTTVASNHDLCRTSGLTVGKVAEEIPVTTELERATAQVKAALDVKVTYLEPQPSVFE